MKMMMMMLRWGLKSDLIEENEESEEQKHHHGKTNGHLAHRLKEFLY